MTKWRYDTCACGARKMERSAKCLACYKRWPDRFWAKVEKTGTCWLWRGQVTDEGYGITSFGGKNHKAHRISWEMAKGPIPDGLTLDHLCRVRACVNPVHLEPVSASENIRRGTGTHVTNARKTHCVNGHEFSPENTRKDRHGNRVCKACIKANSRRHYEKARAAR